MTDAWIDRVKAADAEAEEAWHGVQGELKTRHTPSPTAAALIAIAAELRAQRISRRIGGGQ